MASENETAGRLDNIHIKSCKGPDEGMGVARGVNSDVFSRSGYVRGLEI